MQQLKYTFETALVGEIQSLKPTYTGMVSFVRFESPRDTEEKHICPLCT